MGKGSKNMLRGSKMIILGKNIYLGRKSMFGIYKLKLTELGMSTGSKIGNHYIYMYKNKFLVMTSKPILGMKSHLINNCGNVDGKNKAQYIIEHTHNYDVSQHILITKVEAMNYLIQHFDTFQKLSEIM